MTASAGRRPVRFADAADARADVAALRAGEMHCGNWTLAQACWHVARPLVMCLRAPSSRHPTPDQRAMQDRSREMFKSGAMPDGLPIAPGTEPLADAGDAAIDEYVAGLDALDAYRGELVDFGPIFGPSTTSFFREFVLFHAAHHFTFFTPTTSTKLRPTLRFADEAAMLTDLVALRHGYRAGGRWTLPQICWHLTPAFVRPLAVATRDAADAVPDAQRERQARWDYYIAHVAPPPGFQAPSNLVPPTDVGDDAVESLADLLREFAEFRGDFIVTAAGPMPVARARGFLLAHAAHHLSYLTPTMKGAADA